MAFGSLPQEVILLLSSPRPSPVSLPGSRPSSKLNIRESPAQEAWGHRARGRCSWCFFVLLFGLPLRTGVCSCNTICVFHHLSFSVGVKSSLFPDSYLFFGWSQLIRIIESQYLNFTLIFSIFKFYHTRIIPHLPKTSSVRSITASALVSFLNLVYLFPFCKYFPLTISWCARKGERLWGSWSFYRAHRAAQPLFLQTVPGVSLLPGSHIMHSLWAFPFLH